MGSIAIARIPAVTGWALAALLVLATGCGGSGGGGGGGGGDGGPAATAPAIASQPASVSVVAGQPASFSVSATGTAPLAYQWTRAGADIAGATSASYGIAATTAADSGAVFAVRVSNSAGSVVSSGATLTVTAPPSGTTPTPQRLSAGPGYTLARMGDGSVIAWGTGMAGGSGPALAGSNARRITGLANIAAVSAFNASAEARPNPGDSAHHNLAISADGTVYGWGYDAGGVTATPSGLQLIDAPVAITRLGAAKAVVTNRVLSIALRADGTVWYTPGTLRLGANPSSNTKQVQGLTNITALADMHSLQNMAMAISADGTLWRLLSSFVANTGPGELDYTLAAELLPGPGNVVQASCAGSDATLAPGFVNTFYCLAVAVDGSVWSWGANGVGQLGDGTQTERSTPAQVAGLSGMRQVLATGGMSYALSNDGRVYSWGGYDGTGAALSGRMPPNSNAGVYPMLLVPGLVPSLADVVQITGAGGDVRSEARLVGVHIAALKSDGTVWTWGADCCMQLGQVTATVTASAPIQVPGVNLN